MFIAALLSLAAAIGAGLALVMLALRAQRSSMLLALGHAVLAIAGLALLINGIVQSAGSSRLYNLAALLLVMALSGGLVLLALRISKREYRSSAPMFVVILHALMGVAAVIALANGYFSS